MTLDHFGLQRKSEGLISTSWSGNSEELNGEGLVLFTLEFKAMQSGDTKDWLKLNSKLTEKEAYSKDYEIMGINLEFSSNTTSKFSDGLDQFNLEVFQNRPNPFYDRTNIPFDLSNSGIVKLKVFDGLGNLIMEKSDFFSSGRNQIQIERSELSKGGVLFYHIETNAERVVKKMIVK